METIGQRIQRKMLEREPPWNRPKLRAELGKVGHKVTVEGLRQYIKDKIKPDRPARRALAKVFKTTEEDIEFGSETPEALREPLAPYAGRKAHPEQKLLNAFARLLPDQQKSYLEEIEALAETNMEMGRLVLRQVKYSQSAEKLPLAPSSVAPNKKPSRTKRPD